MPNLPTDSAQRKNTPLVRGLLDYFPAALAEVARVSVAGNKKHNPGEELHHARGKSMDHADCIVRHLVDRGGYDAEGVRHSASVAWRALALLQEELEAEGAPLARGARLPLEHQPVEESDEELIVEPTKPCRRDWHRYEHGYTMRELADLRRRYEDPTAVGRGHR
jgi:hypothetical protein